MFFRKRVPIIKTNADRELMATVTRVREQMTRQRTLIATFREVDDHTRVQLALQESLFDFLYREARTRQVSGAVVQEQAASQMQKNNFG